MQTNEMRNTNPSPLNEKQVGFSHAGRLQVSQQFSQRQRTGALHP